MDQRRQHSGVFPRIESAYECRRAGAHRREQRLDRLHHAGDATEGERGGAETDHLPIVVSGIAMNEEHRVDARLGVKGGVQMVERGFELAQRTAAH